MGLGDTMDLPPCGYYRTINEVAGVPAGRLVYFHNHGDPGPGVYLPEAWEHNRARFSKRGRTLEKLEQAQSLSPLLPEGVYRTAQELTCCNLECSRFAAGTLVQLGYNAAAEAILFVPHWHGPQLVFPSRGLRVAEDRLGHLQPVSVAPAPSGAASGQPGQLH